MEPAISDYNKRLILLSVIELSGISFFYARQSLELKWKHGEGELEKIQMANDCDFLLDNLYNKPASSGDECAKICRSEKRCTHFTYTTYYGNILGRGGLPSNKLMQMLG
jgi:hypothetical protein